jgi:hypothetical protein
MWFFLVILNKIALYALRKTYNFVSSGKVFLSPSGLLIPIKAQTCKI